MPLGYILTMHDIIDYYTEREEIGQALIAHGTRRKVVSGIDAGIFGRKGTPLTSPEQIGEMMKISLENQLSAVPRKYPSFHAGVSRMARNGVKTARSRAAERGGSDSLDAGVAVMDPPATGSDEAGTDFVIDIDIKTDQKEAFKQGRKVLDLYESFGVPYRVKFSGNASPHIILPADLFPPGLSGERFKSVASKLIQFITHKSHASNIDGTFNSPDHYLRMPYSLNENTGLVSVPFRPEEYNEFRLDWAEAPNVVVRNDWMDVSNESRDGMGAFLAAASVGREFGWK